MDQLKIGKFIADCRKRKNLTQMQLAEKRIINIEGDVAISTDQKQTHSLIK